MNGYQVLHGETYHPDANIKGIKVMYSVNGTGFTVESECSEGAEIGVMINNIVPSSACQLRIISVTE